MQDPTTAGVDVPELRLLPDLAGTEVVDSVGFPIGSVYASVVDSESGLIRYIDVALERSQRHVLVPIGHTRIAPDGHGPVRLRAATLQELEDVPAHKPGDPIHDELEDDVLLAHGRFFYGERYYAHPCFEHTGLFAGEAPIHAGTSSPAASGPLTPLSELEDYEIVDGEPDIRGWPVHAATGGELGTVCEMLVDPTVGKVLYVIVKLDALAHATAIPVGYLVVHEEKGRVRTPSLSADDLHALPAFPEGGFSRECEDALRASIEQILTGPRRFGRCDFRASRPASEQRVE
jgi:hypothetical protein